MTATAKEPLSTEWPITLFHADGVRNERVESQAHYERLIGQGCWIDVRFDPMPDAPLPPPEPMTPEEQAAFTASEIEGLGDQVDAQAQQITAIDERLAAVEKNSHEPFDFTSLIERVEALERSRQGASGVTGAFQDRLNDADTKIAALTEQLANSAAVFQQLTDRIAIIEARKKGGQ